MAKVEIRKVETKRELKAFIDFHYDLYKGSPYDVPDLFSDVMNTLRKDKNAAFEFCEAEYFMAFKGGKMAGRVAALINHRANDTWGRKEVRFGWIDFIDDMEVSAALFKAVEDYGRSKGMTEIVGPLGFTDMDQEGMLTWGFDELGTIATPYNYAYYPEHIRKMGGWEVDNNYLEFKIYVPDALPERLVKLTEMIKKRYGLRIKKLNKKDIFERGYGKAIFKLINDTYKVLYGYSELSPRQIDQYVNQYFPLADLDFITAVEDPAAGDKLVGIAITLPSLSRALQKTRKGRLLPFGWWHLIKALKFHKTKIVDTLLMAVHPDYRNKGVNAVMIADLIPYYIKYGIEYGESQLEMESNNAIQNQWEMFERVNHKRRSVYKRALQEV